MNKNILIICALFAAPFISHAQSSPAGRAQMAAYGGSDARLYLGSHYDVNKKYIVVKLWHSNDPATVEEKEELASLKKLLAKKNIDVLEYQWNTEDDLKKFFEAQNIKVYVNDENGLKLKGDKSSMSTSSKKVLLVLEEGKLSTICSGSNCETNTKYFFKLIASS